MIRITINDKVLGEHLKRFPDEVRTALAAKETQLADALVRKAQGLAPHKSGLLASSIHRRIYPSEQRVTARVYVSGKALAYAGAQEYGARTRPHEIFAAKGRALAFIAGGKQAFAAHVSHPGAIIPRHPFLNQALTQMREQIRVELIETVMNSLTRK
jgi:hypothetical protein